MYRNTTQILIAILVVVVIVSDMKADAFQQPRLADCMKNPFASGCRGISAKRSVLQPVRHLHQQTSSSLTGTGTRFNGDQTQLPSGLIMRNPQLVAELIAAAINNRYLEMQPMMDYADNGFMSDSERESAGNVLQRPIASPASD